MTLENNNDISTKKTWQEGKRGLLPRTSEEGGSVGRPGVRKTAWLSTEKHKMLRMFIKTQKKEDVHFPKVFYFTLLLFKIYCISE